MYNTNEMDKVAEYYKKYGAIKDTAICAGMSESKVRRILITMGLYENETSKKINRLFSDGKSVEEIAKELHCTTKCVNEYLPYSKGIYNSSTPTQNALNIRVHRKKPIIF